jgi:hypothetical protein
VACLDRLRADARAAQDRDEEHDPGKSLRELHRLKLLKIGAVVRVSVRRVKLAMSQACPNQGDLNRLAPPSWPTGKSVGR